MKIADLEVFSFFQYAVISFSPGSNIVLGEAFSKILSQHTYLNSRDKISHLENPVEKKFSFSYFNIIIFR
jgi:hypothetical protein